jgi:outer membrane lipoprotein SlyB
MQKAVVCVVQSRDEAIAIIEQLQAAGIANAEISAVFPHHEDGHEFARKYQVDIPDAALPGGVVGGTAGAFIGGTIGLLAGVGALAIPGIGPLVAAGPLVALLAGASTGATFGAVAGGLITLGIPEAHAKHLENKLKDGQILLSVHTESAESFEKAERIFKTSNATDLTATPHPPATS